MNSETRGRGVLLGFFPYLLITVGGTVSEEYKCSIKSTCTWKRSYAMWVTVSSGDELRSVGNHVHRLKGRNIVYKKFIPTANPSTQEAVIENNNLEIKT